MKQINWKINEQGSILFPKHSNRISNGRYSTSDIFEKPIVAYVVMVVCAVIDFAMFRQLFKTLLYDSLFTQYVSIFGLLIGFDAAPIYLGMNLKKMKMKYEVNKLLQVYAPAAAFAIALIINTVFRIMAKDILLPGGNAFSGGSSESNEYALIYAVFTVVVPIITSLTSLAISYTVSNPLKQRLAHLKKYSLWLGEKIRILKSVVTEYDADDYKERLTREDDENFHLANAEVYARTAWYAGYVAERIKEHLADPASTTVLSKDRFETLKGKLKEWEERSDEAQKAASEELEAAKAVNSIEGPAVVETETKNEETKSETKIDTAA